MNKRAQGKFSAYMFLLPAAVIYLSVIVIPVIYSFVISLTKWNGIGKMEFVGLKNYQNLFTNDPVFLIAVKNNLIWIVLTIFVTMTVALFFAVMLSKEFKGRTFFRGFFYFPAVIAPIVVSIIWRWIYNPNIGFINQFCQALHIDYAQEWLSNPKVSIYAIFFASLWQAIGQPMILFLAGIQAISPDVQEAAKIDGAVSIKQFVYITIPMLKESFVIVIATLIVSAMKVYDVVAGLTGGGPNNATQMLSTYMQSQTFQYSNVGTGTALACIMVLIMMVVIIPYVLFTAKED